MTSTTANGTGCHTGTRAITTLPRSITDSPMSPLMPTRTTRPEPGASCAGATLIGRRGRHPPPQRLRIDRAAQSEHRQRKRERRAQPSVTPSQPGRPRCAVGGGRRRLQPSPIRRAWRGVRIRVRARRRTGRGAGSAAARPARRAPRRTAGCTQLTRAAYDHHFRDWSCRTWESPTAAQIDSTQAMTSACGRCAIRIWPCATRASSAYRSA